MTTTVSRKAATARTARGSLDQKIQLLPAQSRHEVLDFVDFLLAKYPATDKQRPKAGCMKGTFTGMSDDFNAPLDDFRDYR
jgi:hypothetical protein